MFLEKIQLLYIYIICDASSDIRTNGSDQRDLEEEVNNVTETTDLMLTPLSTPWYSNYRASWDKKGRIEGK